ncbi:FZO1 (YBR179C) [Zygosaccharomyces parabailii]|nr:FZO1 (YBR179C) [Zygosaccharomyces parabailii]
MVITELITKVSPPHLTQKLARESTSMSQKSLQPSHAGGVDDEDDDGSTVAPSQAPSHLSYSRRQGSFIVRDEDEEALDDSATVYSGNVHTLHPRKTSHVRSLSNERLLSAQLSQLNYNNNRVSLNRAILQVHDLLQQIEMENGARPIHMPLKDNGLRVLNLQLKIGGNYSERGEVTLDKKALAKLFETQLRDALNHLCSLQKRVDDVSSKVFITGDVNTGKSSFCNSLLKRRLLPEDQLPCTNVFCEILEARENDNVEEVHALSAERAQSVKGANAIYNIRDKSTYETFPLTDLDELVLQNDKYVLLKIYIKDDKRPAETSLLRNGTVDISLIDSPGLNMDSMQTAEVMTRQEEIDMVIFVVNAENQLTLSAKEFIALASREKKFMFFVVKKFDKIRDKQRCKDLILRQIKDLSPETYKSSSQFIHFLSHESGDPGGGDDGDDGDPYDNNDPDPDFDRLENSLRNFVLKRRSVSKLLPAKTYLCKLLCDIQLIAEFNIQAYQEEDEDLYRQMEDLKPKLARVKAGCEGLANSVDRLAEETVTDIYEFTRQRILSSLQIPLTDFPTYQGLSQIHDFIFQTEQFIKDRIKDCVLSSEVYAREQTQMSVERVSYMDKEELGDEFMSNRVFKSELMFTKKRHFFGKKLSVPLSMSQLFAPSWEGFFRYLSWDMGLPTAPVEADDEATASEQTKTDNGLTSALGLKNYSLVQYCRKPSLLFTSKIPTLAVYSFGGARVLRGVVIHGVQFFSWGAIKRIGGSVLFVGSLLSLAYLVHDLPRALPKNLSLRYKNALQDGDYVHANAERISREVREVLRVPTREIIRSCELVIDKKYGAQRELEKKRHDNALSMKYLQQIRERAVSQRQIVERINLEVD